MKNQLKPVGMAGLMSHGYTTMVVNHDTIMNSKGMYTSIIVAFMESEGKQVDDYREQYLKRKGSTIRSWHNMRRLLKRAMENKTDITFENFSRWIKMFNVNTTVWMDSVLEVTSAFPLHTVIRNPDDKAIIENALFEGVSEEVAPISEEETDVLREDCSEIVFEYVENSLKMLLHGLGHYFDTDTTQDFFVTSMQKGLGLLSIPFELQVVTCVIQEHSDVLFAVVTVNLDGHHITVSATKSL